MPSSYAVGDHFEQFIKQQVEGGATLARVKSFVTDSACSKKSNSGARPRLEALRTK
ncbi:MAG: hypothetical protein USCGTAYLOR_03020 [Chromatiales bacterium USCg_Taylor]|jgi:hypothetical protein|nr:MAG: hypothetical protein USCGTAYLOR_03020 [Chromatiales bacterium USCg_Taylor]